MPFPGFLSTVGKVVGGLVQSGANYLFGRNQQVQQNAYNERMIDKMNSYNSPTASMNRLIAAGVSPKAALNSLADSPSLGAQSAVNTATPYQGNAPATDFATSLSSMYANDLVSAQAQNTRAATANDQVRLQIEARQATANIQRTISETQNINSKTLTENLMRLFHEQEHPFTMKFLEARYVQDNLVTAAWHALSPSEQKQVIKNSKNKLYDDISYDAQKSRANVRNFTLENNVARQRFMAEFAEGRFLSQDYNKKVSMLNETYLLLNKRMARDAALYGWETKKINHEVEKADLYFSLYDKSLITSKSALDLQHLHNDQLLANPGWDTFRQIFFYGQQTLQTALDVYGTLSTKPNVSEFNYFFNPK